jgi:Fic family protein
MITPSYTLTPSLLANLQEIERLYGRLEGMTIPQSLQLNLERDNLIQSAYSSNKIEGNPLTQAEVTNLLLDDRVPVNRDEKEVVNYFEILKKLDTYSQGEINLDTVLSIHKHLMNGVDDKIKGDIRSSKIVVGRRDFDGNFIIKHDPPFHDRKSIIDELTNLFHWVHSSNDASVIKAGIFHHQFVYIHPFEDGNGRTCRLLTALLFLKYGYKINKYFVLDDYYDIDREDYSDSLHSADNGELSTWLEYFTDGLKHSLQSSLSKVENGLSNLTFDIRPTNKERELLELFQSRKEMNSNDVRGHFQVSRQQAFNLLNGLVEKGFLEKVGSTKSTYYKLK